ncbi:unnamed protein product [Coccothraustes coccothraustes]
MIPYFPERSAVSQWTIGSMQAHTVTMTSWLHELPHCQQWFHEALLCPDNSHWSRDYNARHAPRSTALSPLPPGIRPPSLA